jgi:tetratricopeptide (TPR) repeat protein
MTRNGQWHIIFLLFLPVLLGAQPNQKLITEGDNSPAIYAKNVSLQYDVSQNLVRQLLDVFDKEGVPFSSQKERIDRLIKKYKKLAAADIRDRELTEASKQKLGVADSKALENVLEWDIYIQTQGDNSPAILALGDVQIRYDVPVKAFIAIAERLLSQSQTISDQIVAISNFQQQLNAQIERYKKLEEELAFRYDNDEVAQQAYALLEKGELDAAFRLLEEDYFSAKKRTAYKAYQLSLAKYMTGEYEQTARFLREARDMDPDNARYWQAAAELMLDMGNFEQVEPLALKAIYLDTLANGKQAEELAATYRVLGVLAQTRKNLDQAWTYFDQARQLDSLHQSQNLSLNLNGMGQVRAAQYRYEEAMACYYRAFQIDSSSYGDLNPKIAGHLKNVALLHKQTKNLGAALELFNLVLDIDTTAYGFAHPEVAGDLKNIGRLYEAAGEYEAALVFHQLALSVDSVLYPAQHPVIAGNYKNMGLAHFHLGHIEQADALHQKSLAIDTLFYPAYHPTVGANYTNLGMVYLKQKAWRKGETAFQLPITSIPSTTVRSIPRSSPA